MSRFSGKVRWFCAIRGYGFIARDGADDVFVHFSAVLKEGFRSLREGAEATYEVVEGPKGVQAINVRPK